MIINNPTVDKIKEYNENLYKYIEKNNKLVETRYVDLGVKTLRILNYSKEFTHLMEKQLTYSIKNSADKYDATLILWKEKNVKNIYSKIANEYNPKNNLKMRAIMLAQGIKGEDLWVFDSNYSKTNPIIRSDIHRNIIEAIDVENNTYFLGVENLDPEEFIKEGHIFVQIFNKVLKTDTTNLVHGAAVGFDGNGILFCARGQRGKSTLTVLSMMKGFEYVSDDYLTLQKEGDKLYTYPIYSIITLSPRMYNELYDELKESRFLFNNARKDKYVINIANFHKQFRAKYPVKLCMFPEIVSDKEPSIELCSKKEKGRAIVQLVQSSVFQMQDVHNHKVIKKITDMVKDYDFYKINLCNDINKNTEFLREFLKNYKPADEKINIDKMLVDITFDLANILDSENGILYSMNKFATSIYNNLLQGASYENIIGALSTIKDMPLSILPSLEKFMSELNKHNLLDDVISDNKRAYINPEFVKECDCKLSFIRYDKDCIKELI